MSLSDIMSGSGTVGYAEIALVISFVAFLGVTIWVLLRPREEMEAKARLALDADNTSEDGGDPEAGDDDRRPYS